MNCEQVERQLGFFVDNELSAPGRREVETHVESCASCRTELRELRELADRIAHPDSADLLVVPLALWTNIERRLDPSELASLSTSLPSVSSVVRPLRRFGLGKGPWAIAAGMILVVGLGMVGFSSLDTNAHASTVDFGGLLDALPLDAPKAFRRFLIRYDAQPTTPVAAKRMASDLSFEIPAIVPGGFRLQSVYELRIGGAKGIAAAYDRDGEFLAVVFHPPMKHEKFGSHENHPCVIGGHCGHKVRVGEWKLVHLTDATTCHCLLSRLDEKSEMPAVMAAIATSLSETGMAEDHHHP